MLSSFQAQIFKFSDSGFFSHPCIISLLFATQDDNSSSHMSRKDIRENVIEIRHSKHSDRWLLTKKRLDASKVRFFIAN